MKPFRIAQVAAVRTTVDVDDPALRLFAEAFSDDLDEWLVVGIPFSFDQLTVTTRLVGAHGGNRLRDLALDLDLAEGALADALDPLDHHPIEASLTVGRGGPVEVQARFVGPWTRWKAFEALPRLGVSAEATLAWDRALGTLRTSEVLSVAVAVGRDDPRFEVEAEQRFDGRQASARAAQLAWAAGEMGIGDAKRLASLYEGLCAREHNVTPWALFLDTHRLLPTVRVTVPSVPVALVLQLMGGLGAAPGHATRLGALLAAMGVQDDVVWRLHLEATGNAPVTGSIEVRG